MPYESEHTKFMREWLQQMNLRDALDTHESVALERVHYLVDVVPHLGVDIAGAVGQRQ